MSTSVSRSLSLLAGLSFLVLFAGVSLAETIVINGSTTVLPVAQPAAEAYMKRNPDVNISISGGGSGNGVKALLDKTADIANSSRFLKDGEIKMACEKGIFPVAHRIAMDAIVPIVHPSNAVTNLTVAQLSLMYQGKITNWKEVGGIDGKIVIISRDTSSGTFEVWQEKVLHDAKVAPRALMQASNGAIVQAVSKNKYAIGYIGIGYVNTEVKPLRVNGIEASAKTALSGVFPVVRPLFMFTSGWPTGNVSDFINFMVSPEGQNIVKKEGFVPLY